MTHILITSHHVLILHILLENKAEGRKLAMEKNVALAPGLAPRHGGGSSPPLFIQCQLVDFPVKDGRGEESSVCLLCKVICLRSIKQAYLYLYYIPPLALSVLLARINDLGCIHQY